MNSGAPIQLQADGDSLRNKDNISAASPDAAVSITGNNVELDNAAQAVLTADDTAVQVAGDNADIENDGTISGGQNGISVSGRAADIDNRGSIDGGINGVSINNPGENNSRLTNSGEISSDSRAVDLDGDGVRFKNTGDIVGTGDQRNGTTYLDGTADNVEIDNKGVIDGGAGNVADGLTVQVGSAEEDALSQSIDIDNSGEIIGRGTAEFDGGRVNANGSSGLRFFNGSAEDRAEVSGNVDNQGTISSEATAGFFGGLVIEDGVNFSGKIDNEAEGVITGVRNGLYVGNSDHALEIENDGLISSGSRAVNLDGNSVSFENDGVVLGLDNQRNGTLYVDGSADQVDVKNSGTIDAGVGNTGDGITVQVGLNDAFRISNDINIANHGDILGRGTAEFDGGRVTANGSSGVRYFDGTGTGESVLRGSLENSGAISSETETGFLGGVVVEDGVAFEGDIHNRSDGTISGPRNGLYIGNATHDLKIENDGTIESGSRAVNLDGDNVSFDNEGAVHGTGDQRNGTLYVDGTGDNIHIDNSGTIDAGAGNNGSGVSIQVGANGETADLETSVDLVNDGLIQGRGDGNVPAGIRLFTGSGLDQATFTGAIRNDTEGTIASENSAGILIDDGVIFNGHIVNNGAIEGGNGFAIDAENSLGHVDITNNGTLSGDVRLGTGNDSFTQNSDAGVTVFAGRGADTVTGGDGDDVIAGGGGADVLDGGGGNDTNSFADIGAPVVANLGGGIATYMPNPNVTIVESFTGFENLDGSRFGDLLTGDDGANSLSGNDGDDVLAGGRGNDALLGGDGDDILRGGGGNDDLDGGAGTDTADFSDIGPDVTASLQNNGSGEATYLVNGNVITDSFQNIENLTGSATNDQLSGDAQNNLLAGAAGDDQLFGGDGDDILRGDEIGDGTAVRVTVTNHLDEGGTFLTPLWFGFHDGTGFDLFDTGSSASIGLERLAEDGTVAPISAEFLAQAGNNGVDGTIFGFDGAPGPIDPGETASQIVDIPEAAGQAFFTWATMVIPSNDAFLSVPDDPLADPVFDMDGNFIGGQLTITRTGADVLDAGTEVNNEMDVAFLGGANGQNGPNQGEDENGVITVHPGFNGSAGNPGGAPANILGGVTAAGTAVDPTVSDFTADNDALLTITFELLSNGGGDDHLNGGAGNDILEGGGGRDTFIAEQGTGQDQILDFNAMEDILDLSDFGFASVTDVANASIEADGNTIIDLDGAAGNDQLTLFETAIAELDDSNLQLA